MSVKNKLTIYLIKDDFTDFDKIINSYQNVNKINDDTCVYFNYSTNIKPRWVTNFLKNLPDTDKMFVANARAVLLKRINFQNNYSKIFAITMGYGKNMLSEDVTVERFGLKVTLNCIKDNSIRRLNRINIGGNQKYSHEQLPLKSSIYDFDININSDLVSYITGETDSFVKGIVSGGDALTCSADVDISNIDKLLIKIFNYYKSEKYKENYEWIDHIKEVTSESEKEMLNKFLIESINNSCNLFWMAEPEIIPYEHISGYKYHGNKIFENIDINEVKQSFRKKLTSIEQLKSKKNISYFI